MELPQIQHDALAHLARAAEPTRIQDIAAALRQDQSPIAAACVTLAEGGFIAIAETPFDELRRGPDAPPPEALWPERQIVAVLQQHAGRCRITEIPNHCPLPQSQVGQSLRYLADRGWARKDGDSLVLAVDIDARLQTPQPDEQLLAALTSENAARRPDLEKSGIDVAAALKLLAGRKNFVIVKQRIDRFATITRTGRELLDRSQVAQARVTQLTPELLADGGWRNVDFQPYDVTLAAERLYPGKEHAFQRTLDKVRRVFLEMGFTEVVSPWVESSFWDFDALFQPQDHPARDMQDTFYVSNPSSCTLPDDALVQRIGRVHENGGDTGSTGWQYRWKEEISRKPVLRTHTTAATIRALAAHSEKYTDVGAVRSGAESAGVACGRYFVIGPVFRRETVDYKHLPMFHQVDGIIVDHNASLSSLLGTLSAFYAKMGYPKIRFRPSFFPYTEPSAEVYLWLEHRGEWMEMGGSGIFRPEVTQPLGIRDRVLAWGLGLERLAMMIHGLQAIGELYFASMPWLREAPVARA